jgi:hypothetical protein
MLPVATVNVDSRAVFPDRLFDVTAFRVPVADCCAVPSAQFTLVYVPCSMLGWKMI